MRIYTRGKSKTLWYDFGVGGQRYRGSTGETGKREARLKAEALYRAAQAKPPPALCWTIGQVIGTWYAEKIDGGPSADSIWYQVEAIERCIDTVLPISTLTNALLMEFRAKRRGEGCGPVGINRGLSYIRAAIGHCHRVHTQPSPVIAWRDLRYAEPEERIRFAGFDEYAALLAAADVEDARWTDGPVIRAMIETAVGTGMRRGNLFALAWSQIDLRGGNITLARTKGRKPLIIATSAPVKKALETLRAVAMKRDGGCIPTGAVFTLTNYRRKWRRVRDAAGCPDLHWHDLRHTFGTYARKGGVDLLALKEAMAHRSIQSTMRYAHVTADDIANSFDRAAAVAARAAQPTAQKKKKHR